MVPLQNALEPILAAWKLKTGGEGLVLRPKVAARGGRPELGSAPRFVQIHTPHDALDKALTAAKLPALTWYQATRHTYASQWVLSGGTIERLGDLLGHDSVKTTERYAHLRPDHFGEADFGRLAVDLRPRKGKVVQIGSQLANSNSNKGRRERS